MSLNVRVVQMQVIQGDFDKNLTQVSRYIEECSKHKIDLVVFPQYTITGYPTDDIVTALGESKLDIEGEVSLLAEKYNINVIYNHVEPYENGFADFTVFINKNGIVEEKYKRVNKFWREDRCLVGDEYKVVEVNGIRVGLMAGDDIYYPEISRELALEKVNVIVCLFYNANHRFGNAFDTKSILSNMITTYAIVNEVDFVFCSAEGSIDNDDKQSIISGSILVGESSVFSISEGKMIKVDEVSKVIDTTIDIGKISFYRMICRRVENLRSDVYKNWRDIN